MMIMEIVEMFKKKYKDRGPIGVCFLTESNRYIFDAGTNKVISCDEIEFEVINKLFHHQIEDILKFEELYSKSALTKALKNIIDAMESEHILQVTQFKPMLTEPYYKEMIENGQQQMTLELTEQCNLRCKYCIYHDSFDKDRNFGNKVMTKETAFKAIDCFQRHTADQEEIALTFYGGEPLLEFNLMRECMDYAKEIFVIRNKQLRFSFTTNLTLVTPEIAEYLATHHGIHIIGSLDGPEEIHDRYRVDLKGNGSFKRALRGLKYLVEAFKERASECIELNMVYAPPYSVEKLGKIEAFFDSLEWLPKTLDKRMGYVDNGTLPKEIEEELAKELAQEEYQGNTLMQRAKTYVGEEKDFSKDVMEKALLRIYHLPVLEEASEQITTNGCCLPGHRRLYVTVDGDFKMCERVGRAPNIGSVDEGINIDLIKKEYLDNYAKLSHEDCSVCWAARLCGVCYSHCYKSGSFSIEDKRVECDSIKWNMWNTLGWYYEILETDPDKVAYIEEIKVV